MIGDAVAIAPIACSRTPKWRCRPPGVSRRNDAALLTSVLVDGARSASPPTRCGSRGETRRARPRWRRASPRASPAGTSGGPRPTRRAPPGLPVVPLGRELREGAAPGVESPVPGACARAATRPRGSGRAPAGQGEPGPEGPAERLLGAVQLRLAERLAMGLVRAGPPGVPQPITVRTAISDAAPSRLASRRPGRPRRGRCRRARPARAIPAPRTAGASPRERKPAFPASDT